MGFEEYQDGPEELVAAGRRAHRRRGRIIAAATGVTVLALLGGVAAFLARPDPASTPEVDNGPGAAPVSAAAGWRLESSLGALISVPEDWGRNDFGCGMSQKPSVVRGQMAATMCLTPEPSTKEVAILDDGLRAADPPDPPGLAELPSRAVTVGTAPATRADGRLPDGRFAGWVAVPSARVRLSVRTLTEATTQHILDSLQVVAIDHLGCRTRRPTDPGGTAPGDTLVPAAATAVNVCLYGESEVLQASVGLAGDEAAQLVASLNRARAGANPDAPPDMCLPAPPDPPGVLLVVKEGSMSTVVRMTFSGCAGRGLDNGARTAQVTQSIIHQVLRPLGGGYAFSGDLP